MYNWKLTREKRSSFISIAVTNRCNLRCPSCPITEIEVAKPRYASIETVRAILEKASREFNVLGIQTFGVTEPMLHPDLAGVIRAINEYNFPCIISTNLNVITNIEDIMEAAPGNMVISVSGFHQDTYGNYHKNGNIEKVKKNMKVLRDAWIASGKKSLVDVVFHRYIDNLDEEKEMEAYARDLGFGFKPIWAGLIKMQKVMQYIESGYNMNVLTPEERDLVGRLAMDFQELMELFMRERDRECYILTEQFYLDHDGNVAHCTDGMIGNYLEKPLAYFDKVKRQSDLCRRCKVSAGHLVTNAYCHEELVAPIEELALKRVKAYREKNNLPPLEMTKVLDHREYAQFKSGQLQDQ